MAKKHKIDNFIKNW